MKNPKPEELSEKTIQHFLQKEDEVRFHIKNIKVEFKYGKIPKDEIKYAKECLAQWKYILWRIERNKKKNWRIA